MCVLFSVYMWMPITTQTHFDKIQSQVATDVETRLRLHLFQVFDELFLLPHIPLAVVDVISLSCCSFCLFLFSLLFCACSASAWRESLLLFTMAFATLLAMWAGKNRCLYLSLSLFCSSGSVQSAPNLRPICDSFKKTKQTKKHLLQRNIGNTLV